jgi:hypothetical protein
MPVLIIVISAYLFFFAVIALIAVAEFADRRERNRRPIARIRVSLASILVGDAADPVFAPLWDAHVPALRLISASGLRGFPTSSLHPCFSQLTRRIPEIFEGHTLDEWLQFLEHEQLVTCRNGLARITVRGKEFLRNRLATTLAS